MTNEPKAKWALLKDVYDCGDAFDIGYKQGNRAPVAINALLKEVRGYLQCVVDSSMSLNNAEALAVELIEQIDAAIGKEQK